MPDRHPTGMLPTLPCPPARRATAARRALTLALLVAIGGCDLTSGPSKRATVRLTLSTHAPTPRDVVRVGVAVFPTPGDRIAASWMIVEGGGARDSLRIPFEVFDGSASRTADFQLTFRLEPVRETIRLTAYVRAASGLEAEATDTIALGDTVPPVIDWSRDSSTVVVGDSVQIGARYVDNAGLDRVELHLAGAVTTDAVFPLDHAPRDELTLSVSVPNVPGDSIVVTAIAADMYGMITQARRVYRIVATDNARQ